MQKIENRKDKENERARQREREGFSKDVPWNALQNKHNGKRRSEEGINIISY